MTYTHDLIVIGAGSGGLGAAGIAARLDLKVALIDKSDYNIGGDCLNYGCVPSKALITVARYFQGAREAQAFGLECRGVADLGQVMDCVRAKQDIIRERENAAYLEREEGINVRIGWATFVDEHTVEVADERLTAPKIVLATGSTARRLTVPGAEEVGYYTNETLWDLRELPEHLLIVGGGPIGCEMAQAFRRLGSEVTIVEQGERILGVELPEISQVLADCFEREGIRMLTGAELQDFPTPTSVRLTLADGQEKTVPFSHALVAIGRNVNTEGMHLDKAGVTVKDGKIVVDDELRTTCKHIWAIGDSAGMEKFSHGAEMHNRMWAYNMIVPVHKKKHTTKHLSWVTFTDPEVASFGYTQQQLDEQGIAYEKITQDFTEDDRAVVAGYHDYGLLILFLSKPGLLGKPRLLGGTMIAPHAGELIQEFILANMNDLSTDVFFDKLYPYPTAGRINQKPFVDRRSDGLNGLTKAAARVAFRAAL